jgi:hypothetical protein
VRAWRVLDIACQRYRYEHKFTIQQLLDALEEGEQIIAEVEHVAQPNREGEQKPPPVWVSHPELFAHRDPRLRHSDNSNFVYDNHEAATVTCAQVALLARPAR